MSEESLAKEKKLEEIKKEAEEKKCPLQRILHYVNEFLAGPMCGKCYPCAFGTAEARIRLTRLNQHLKNVSVSDIQTLRRIGINMMEGSFCKKGKDTGKFIVETIAGSEEEFRQHLAGICPEKECIGLVEYVINPELCSMCGKCSEVCYYGAIIGETRQSYLSGYLPFEIRQRRCTKCGACVTACPSGAIEVVTKQKEELVGKE